MATTEKQARNLRESASPMYGRTLEMELFIDKLDRIARQGPVSSNLHEYYGAPRIGKSMLLTAMAQEAQEKGAITAIVDFKQRQADGKNDSYDPTLLMEDILTVLTTGIDIDEMFLADFRKTLQKYRQNIPAEGIVAAYNKTDQETKLYNRPEWLNNLRAVDINFLKIVNNLGYQGAGKFVRPVVLMFDQMDSASIEFLDFMEEWVINPVVQIKHCLIGAGVRRPWRWKRPEIRRRLQSTSLGNLNVADTSMQLEDAIGEKTIDSDVVNIIYRLTGGHPGVNALVAAELNRLTSSGETKNLAEPIVQIIYKDYLEPYVLRNLESPQLKTAFLLMGFVHMIDATMLQEIITTNDPKLFRGWEQEDFGELLNQLKKTNLIIWSQKGLEVDPVLSHIIQNYYAVTSPDIYKNIHRSALKVYDRWLEKPLYNRGLFALEYLYHSATLQSAGNSDIDLIRVIDKLLNGYKSQIRHKSTLHQSLEVFEHSIREDFDLERLTGSSTALADHIQAFSNANT